MTLEDVVHKLKRKAKSYREEALPGPGSRNPVRFPTLHPRETCQLIPNGFHRGHKKRRNLYYSHDWIHSRIKFFSNTLQFFFSFKRLLNAFSVGNVLRVNTEMLAPQIALRGHLWLPRVNKDIKDT